MFTVTTENYAAALKDLQKQLSALQKGIEDALSKKNAVLIASGIDPNDIEGSLKRSKLSPSHKKAVLKQLDTQSQALPAPAEAKAPKQRNNPNRLSV